MVETARSHREKQYKGDTGYQNNDRKKAKGMKDKSFGLCICKFHDKIILKIGTETIPVKDYKITSSMHNGTGLVVTIQSHDSIMEFVTSAKIGMLQTQPKTTTNGVP